MIPFSKSLTSSVGRKFLMALSGISLVIFIILHLLGNLSLYFPKGDVFNVYAHKLESLGPLKLIGEIGLIVLFGAHIVTAIMLTMKNKSARPEKYVSGQKTKGGESKFNVSSTKMAVTGFIILIFLIIHIKQFTLGPGVSAGYVTEVSGTEMRDLHKLVVETFQNPMIAGFYVFIMILLGLHLRHGFWSAFQSLGVLNPRFSKPIYSIGVVTAILLAVGFLGIPLWIYFDCLGVYK